MHDLQIPVFDGTAALCRLYADWAVFIQAAPPVLTLGIFTGICQYEVLFTLSTQAMTHTDCKLTMQRPHPHTDPEAPHSQGSPFEITSSNPSQTAHNPSTPSQRFGRNSGPPKPD